MNDSGPAFPTPIAGCNDGCVYPASQVVQNGGGMSLRDWFAGMALQGILANPKTDTETEAEYPRRDWVHRAYDLADKMLYEHMNKK